jgi:hypothetical protein
LMNSRPLFSQILSRSVTPVCNFDSFDSLLKVVFDTVVDVKKIFSNGYYGRIGQIRLFQNAHTAFSDVDGPPTALIHSHFAQLSGEKNLILKNDGCLDGKDVLWKPSSVFPLVNDDVLLYLILMGGKDYPAFRLDSCLIPYVYFLLSVIDSVDHRTHILDLRNSAQNSNDGPFLESLLCSTVCLSSHSNGIQGISLQNFLLDLLFQLQNSEKVKRTDIFIDGLNVLDTLQMKIPYLSPPNMQWSDYLEEIPQSNFGNLKRARNSDRVDLLADGNIAGEAKDYGYVLELASLRKIINRIPKETKLHLVFCRKLRNSYFNRPARTFRTEFANSHVRNMAYFKIDTSKPNTSLETIKGLPYTVSENGIVIFLLIDESVRLGPKL